MARPPIIDELDTRLLERRDVVRAFVRQAETVQVDETGLRLRTEGLARRRRMRGWSDEARGGGETVTGTLRLDVLADGVFRVRYAQDADVPPNETPMLVGLPDGPRRCDVETTGERVVYRTGEATIEIGLKPFTIRVVDARGEEVCLVGGREKNHFGAWDAYNTGICRTIPDARPLAVECFALGSQEAVYGFGEQFIRLDKVGQTIDVNMVEATGTTTPRSYKNVPFFMSTRGYGVFLNHSARSTFWVGSMSAADIQVAVEDDFLDYFVICGDLKTILRRYTELTGKGVLPPKWSFGLWQSKISYRSASEALDVVRRLRAADVPFDVLHLDTHWFREDWRCDLTFDPERFPDPAAFTADLAREGVKLSLWQLPYIPDGSPLFDDLAAADGFVKTEDGEMYDVGICYTPGFGGRVGCIDFTKPSARDVYGRYLRRLFEVGAKAIKVDFGEQAPLDGVYHDGTPGHRAHNLYPLLYNRTVAEVTEEATGEHIIWARSAYAGSQRYPVHWGGDSSTNRHNLVPQMEGGLSFGLSGFQFWSMDIGGFLGATGGALLVRWLQAGVFCSHPRIHGTGPRELDAFEPEVLTICRDYLHLRYRLLPYVYGQAMDCVARSLPMARPLVVEFQDDPTTWRIGDQWLFGEHLLVAPVWEETGRRRVYLPKGTWTDWWTEERVRGPVWLDVEAPLHIMPMWIREGGVVAMGPSMRFVDEVPTETVTLRIGAFEGAGETRATVPVNDEIIDVVYRARDGEHDVSTSPGSAAFDVEICGGQPPR